MNWAELKNIFNECEIIDNKLVVKENIVKTLKFIKENYHFEILKNITAVDNKDLGIELIYQLYNIEDEENVLISITTFDNEVESVTSIFDSATADEKEIYDLFGVKFIGNEELKRIYMPESWDGHPLRKDYQENDERLNWND